MELNAMEAIAIADKTNRDINRKLVSEIEQKNEERLYKLIRLAAHDGCYHLYIESGETEIIQTIMRLQYTLKKLGYAINYNTRRQGDVCIYWSPLDINGGDFFDK